MGGSINQYYFGGCITDIQRIYTYICILGPSNSASKKLSYRYTCSSTQRLSIYIFFSRMFIVASDNSGKSAVHVVISEGRGAGWVINGH